MTLVEAINSLTSALDDVEAYLVVIIILMLIQISVNLVSER